MPELRIPAKHRALCGQSQCGGLSGRQVGLYGAQQTIVESPTGNTGRVTALTACAHAPIAKRTWKGWMASSRCVEIIIDSSEETS